MAVGLLNSLAWIYLMAFCGVLPAERPTGCSIHSFDAHSTLIAAILSNELKF